MSKNVKIKLKKGDKVQVMTGSSKGQSGTILQVFREKGRVVIEGVNLMKKHQKPTNDAPGGINEIEASIDISNVMLVDPKSGEPTKIGRRLEDGNLVRYAKKSGQTLK